MYNIIEHHKVKKVLDMLIPLVMFRNGHIAYIGEHHKMKDLTGRKFNIIASVSFGKDSLAMLLKLLELKYPINEVVFVDTGMEFQAIYDIEKRVKEILKQENIKYSKLELPKPFKYYMFEHKTKSGKQGYSW